ncbi:sterile alpha motif domain-containing protein 9-like isoform X2 [Etheostoma cragini]|nr:sterile alpha motif domain-containing protein 9-like isoform X2 [Etheostoma cragini]
MELTPEERIDIDANFLSQYVQQNPKSTITKLFSYLALLNAYIPEAYLQKTEYQKILGPPEPIHGGPPFEERMKPFMCLINTSSPNPEQISMIHTVVAQRAVELLAEEGISRSLIMKNFMFSLCGDQTQPYILQFIKDLLTKRELGENGKAKFSRLIIDMLEKENFDKAVYVLNIATDKLRQNPIFPQTVSRLYYIKGGNINYKKAEKWAEEAIKRAPKNSYVADTLGQIYKNRLLREAKGLEDILRMAEKAFKAFKDVQRKADNEEGPEMKDTTDTERISNSFNNRGLFGFLQVAKIAFEKLNKGPSRPSKKHGFIQKLKPEVEARFDFFEWYLAYSNPNKTSTEPDYFWKDIVICYELYTTKTAAKSTSFPGLLDLLNHGLITSKGRRARFEEAEETVSELEAIRDHLKTIYEANVDDVKEAERYILSNIILSNKMHNSLQHTPVTELQAILNRFLGTKVGHRGAQFYLLVLMLFWPEEEPRVLQEEDDEEVEQEATEDDESEDKTWEDEESNGDQETRAEPAQLSLDLMFGPDLQQCVTFMEKAFERAKYAKHLRGRYLLPLFFLGTGSGLSKWIHRSRLDAIVEKKVDAELTDDYDETNKNKLSRINEMWNNGDVWQVPEIQNMLLPIQVELCHSPTMPHVHEKEQVFLCVGGQKIMATMEVEEPEAPLLTPVPFYLGFTIRGPVVFTVGCP